MKPFLISRPHRMYRPSVDPDRPDRVIWNPPLTASDEVPGVTYNVYAAPPPSADGAAPVTVPKPLNDAPIDATIFTHPGAEPGKEQCFVVRSVATVEGGTIESDASAPICVTPKDTFPPAPPKGLAAVAGAGAINLIWDASTEADLGGSPVEGEQARAAAGTEAPALVRRELRPRERRDRVGHRDLAL